MNDIKHMDVVCKICGAEFKSTRRNPECIVCGPKAQARARAWGCHNRPPLQPFLSVHDGAMTYHYATPWKDDGACQHDSAMDDKCSGCRWQRKEDREIPTGDGGLSNPHHHQAHPCA